MKFRMPELVESYCPREWTVVLSSDADPDGDVIFSGNRKEVEQFMLNLQSANVGLHPVAGYTGYLFDLSERLSYSVGWLP